MAGGGGQLRSNLAQAESHRVGVVILRDEDAKDKVPQFVAQPVGEQRHQTQTGDQRIQAVEDQPCLHASAHKNTGERWRRRSQVCGLSRRQKEEEEGSPAYLLHGGHAVSSLLHVCCPNIPTQENKQKRLCEQKNSDQRKRLALADKRALIRTPVCWVQC